MADTRHDVVIRAGRVHCPTTGLDGPGFVAVDEGRISRVQLGPSPSSEIPTRRYFDLSDGLLLPGLIDLHAHPGEGLSKYGVDPDTHMLARGTTTILSQGDAGASNWREFHDRVVATARMRVILAMNLSAEGESMQHGCFEDLNNVNADACVAAINESGEWVWGIAVNIGQSSCGQNEPREIFRRALDAAERTEKPLLFGARRGYGWALDDQLQRLRPGDIITYCFSGEPESIVRGGRVRDCVWEAQERGVVFDVGHGYQSFDYRIAETALADGFIPDTISTDFYRRHLETETLHDLPLTVSKLVAIGLNPNDAWPRVTSRPAGILGLNAETGAIAEGLCADLSALRWKTDPSPLSDVFGNVRAGGKWEPVLTVRAGEVIEAET
jgi:dihydroorotase